MVIRIGRGGYVSLIKWLIVISAWRIHNVFSFLWFSGWNITQNSFSTGFMRFTLCSTFCSFSFSCQRNSELREIWRQKCDLCMDLFGYSWKRFEAVTLCVWTAHKYKKKPRNLFWSEIWPEHAFVRFAHRFQCSGFRIVSKMLASHKLIQIRR